MHYIDSLFQINCALITRTLYDLGNNTQQIAYVIQRCQSLGMTLLFLNDLGPNILEINISLTKILSQLKTLKIIMKKLNLKDDILLHYSKEKY